jgi:uncharacterized protein (DUF3820 family)
MKESNEEPKLTYTDRLCLQFAGSKKYTSEQVQEIIRNFAAAEFEKKKLDSKKLPFGKYKNRSIKEVLSFDKNYLVWLSKQEVSANFPELHSNIKQALVA